MINQGVIGQLWPPKPQCVEHILLLLGLLTRTNWRGGKKGGVASRGKEKKQRWKVEGQWKELKRVLRRGKEIRIRGNSRKKEVRRKKRE